MLDKLIALYRLIHFFHGINIKDRSTFLRYLYSIDSIRLRDLLSPYIWEDYIFIDEELFKIIKSYDSPFQPEDMDKISEFDAQIVKTVVEESLVIDYNVENIDHIQYLPEDREGYGGTNFYINSRENHFLFHELGYTTELRERKINKIIDYLKLNDNSKPTVCKST